MKCGWPAIVTVVTKDQYGDVVHVPNLKVGGSQQINILICVGHAK
jgi:hypothetical protein